MPVTYKKNAAVFTEQVSIEDAEAALQWFQAHPKARVDLGNCHHMHACILQVLVAAAPVVSVWPRDPSLAAWVSAALIQRG